MVVTFFVRIIRIIKKMCINLVAKNINTEYDDSGYINIGVNMEE